MSSAVLEPFTAQDGENLALYEWPLDSAAHEQGPAAAPLRGAVLIVHGLGEHACRYERLACQLLDWGFAVRAYDQRGHGDSTGRRGVLPSDTALLDDLAEMVDDTRLHCGRQLTLWRDHGAAPGPLPPLPLILLGHSLGGLVASRFVSLNIRPVDGLVLSSPALDLGLNALQKLLLAALPGMAPDLPINSGLNPKYLSHDAHVVRKYRADPLVHAQISGRLARFMESAGLATVAAAQHWNTPTLLLYAGADKLVNPAGSRAFAAAAAMSPDVRPGLVTSHCFEELYHEIFNEADPAPVYEALQQWLDQKFSNYSVQMRGRVT